MHFSASNYISNSLGSFRSSSNLQHYCRVCNTQLNSCKQVKIHVSGKKHEKRFNYLKYSIETSKYTEFGRRIAYWK